MEINDYVPDHPEDHVWDTVIIGTGAGGAPAGLRLAQAGKSVLFIERGTPSTDSSDHPFCTSLPGVVEGESSPYENQSEGSGNTSPAFYVASRIGGTTAVFSMVMDRFRPIDFTPGQSATIAPSSSLPHAWPIQYTDLDPYYEEAERLFRVRGTTDPLSPHVGGIRDILPPSYAEQVVHDALEVAGLHPYRLHYAREHATGCTGCIGKYCPKNCRNDAARMCVLPALEKHGARILPSCLVTKLESRGRSLRQATCLWKGRYIAIRGRLFILALNAALTPALLLRSASDLCPDGLGNRSGMVGRNLMAHVSDYLAVRFKSLHGRVNEQLQNGLSLNDFYSLDGVKLGNIHAHAMDVGDPTTGTTSRADVNEPAGVTLFATIVEDFPYVDNRITPKQGTQGGICWTYHYPEELRKRSQRLMESFENSLRPWCSTSIRQPSGLLNASHTCGTCRFGDDPRTSVLDRHNRIHDLDNAYVLDASFFPSSGGINPSLTVVANSLRVGALLTSF